MNLKEIFIKNKCDKATKHRYYELYQQDFDKFRNNEINILEIGTFKGESIQSWLDYFPQAKMAELCDSEGISFFNPLSGLIKEGHRKLFYDQCHYTEEGHTVMARLIYNYLTKFLTGGKHEHN